MNYNYSLKLYDFIVTWESSIFCVLMLFQVRFEYLFVRIISPKLWRVKALLIYTTGLIDVAQIMAVSLFLSGSWNGLLTIFQKIQIKRPPTL